MTALLALAVLLAPADLDLAPTDDIWVYPHASDPAKDPFLRVWGAGGVAVHGTPDEMGDFSYSYLAFDLSKAPKTPPKSAILVLTHTADPGWTAAYSKESPLEVRPVPTGFAEKGWDYSAAGKWLPEPDLKKAFGTAALVPGEAGKPFRVEVDLTKALAAAWPKLVDAGKVGFALTSKVDPGAVGRAGVYKFYSKDEENASRRPVLRLVFP